jgi:hypothetical protein
MNTIIKKINSQLITKLLWVFAIFGSSLKILPVAVFDEMMLIIYSIYNGIKNGLPRKFTIFTITLLWFLIISLVGVYTVGIEHSNPNIIRFVVIAIGLLFYRYDGLNFGRAVLVTALLYLLTNLSLPYIGNWLEMDSYWWQSLNFWAGTSSASIAIFYCSLVLLVFSRKNPYGIAFISCFLFFISMLIDSRILLTLSLSVLIVTFLIRHNSIKKNVIQYSIIGCGFFIFLFPTTYLNDNQQITEYKFSKETGINNVLISFRKKMLLNTGGLNLFTYSVRDYLNMYDSRGDSRGDSRDLDRIEHWNAILSLYKRDKTHFFFGHGMLSSQYDLSNYISKSKHSNRIRSTGITVIVFNGGIVLFLLLLLSAFWAAFKIIKETIKVKAPFYITLLCISVPGLAIVVLPLTGNVLDMIIWWLAIAPKGLGYIMLKTYHSNS